MQNTEENEEQEQELNSKMNKNRVSVSKYLNSIQPL